jgi:hypothetical protein
MLALSSFVLMSCATAGLIYLAKQVPIMNLLLFGKALPKQYYQIK